MRRSRTRPLFRLRPSAAIIAGVLLSGCGDGGDRRTVVAAVDDGRGAIRSAPLAARSAPGDGTAMFERLDGERTGIRFASFFEWEHPQRHLYQHGYAGGGVCIGDIDGDDRPDVYLLSQTGPDRLYRQVGDFRFEDVTEAAGLDMSPAWGTGAVFADVDGDGDLDLYACRYDASNRLYLNRGDGTFEENAAEWGVAFKGASVMAGFADYDRDGRLDLYLLTNRLYPGPGRDLPQTRQVEGRVAVAEGLEESFAIQERPIDGETQKFIVKAGQRDRLYRNVGGSFAEVAADAGISGNHPGLSATWWDADGDGWPDLYVANDFWDADRFYRNNRDGTFTDVLADSVPHTPWFSMGADFGDVDDDGRLDLLVADMSATTHYMSKVMMGDMNESRWFLQTAEPRQYMRNALFLNTGVDRFMEIAHLAGVASTDWTWSVKFGDLDNDGRLDLFATTGTANHSFDPDLTRELRELEAAQTQRGLRDPRRRWEEQWLVYRSRPPREEMNLAFRNEGDYEFDDATKAWGLEHRGISFGAALADLDRDGDLDLVVNNVDDAAGVYRNGAPDGHAALVRLVGHPGRNTPGARSSAGGIGATVTVKTSDGAQCRHLAPTRGYMSANEPILHFGLGSADRIESLVVGWPSGHVQRFEDLPADHVYTITEPTSAPPALVSPPPAETLFTEVARDLGLDAPARETPYDDYARQPLLPAKLSQLGPGHAWGDANGNGRDDLFVGGAAGEPGRLFLSRADGTFASGAPAPWGADDDRASEDMAPLWIDADSDGDQDLFVASGGVECEPGADVLRDRLYLNDGAAGFTEAPAGALPDAADSAGAAVAADWDADGDLDLFVGGRVIPGRYPLAPRSRLLRNDGGSFVDVTETLAPGVGEAGLVTGALFSDANDDGRPDLLVTIEWGPVRYWQNTGVGFEERTEAAGLSTRLGWWNGITGADLDGDGDMDYVVTNAGLNTKYAASPEKPALLYYGDFEGTGRMSLVEAKSTGGGAGGGGSGGASGGDVLPVRGLSCSRAAMPSVGVRMPTFHDFASASLTQIYPADCLETAVVMRATELAGGVLVNEGNDAAGGATFAFRPLPRLAQAAPGYGVVASDLDGDGDADVAIAQNFHGREPETGRWDGGLGLLLRGDGTGRLDPVGPADTGFCIAGDATGATVCDLNDDGRPDVVVARNGDRLLAFEQAASTDRRFVAVRLVGARGNLAAAGARVTAVDGVGRRRAFEVYAGSGHLSQSSSWLFFGGGDPGGEAAEAVGGAGRPVEIHVRWPDGRQTVHPVAADADRLILPEPDVGAGEGGKQG